jgi:phosphotransferase system HPr (HPr) family protein
MARRRAEICNALGLHARASRMFVTTAQKFEAKVEVSCEDRSAPADSVLSLLELVAPKGSTIEIAATGQDAEAAVDALVKLVEAGFYESEKSAEGQDK